MKGKKSKLLLLLLGLAVLAVAFYLGGNAPGSRGWQPARQPATATLPAPSAPSQGTALTKSELSAAVPASEPAPEPEPEPEPESASESAPEPTPEPESETADDPPPAKPQEAGGDGALTCTLSISCATILDNMDLCEPEKAELVPADGWIFPAASCNFYEGETVFNVLQRVCKQHKLHLEYVNTPVYNSAYIEGINNIYEFDVGELSGWMYQVNGWFPNYGSSRYQLQDGDVICLVYTCDLGEDIGGGYAAGQQ